MDELEGIMISEISQTKTNTVCFHIYVESKKSQTHGNRVWNGGCQWLAGAEKRGRYWSKGTNLQL